MGQGGIGAGKQVRMDEEIAPPVACSECVIGRTAVYGPTLIASAETISACRREIVKFGAGRVITRANEIPAQIYTLYSGWAFCGIELSGRRRQILSFLVPGDLVALESLCFPGYPLPFFVRALTGVTLCRFPVSGMAEILEGTEAQRAETRAALRCHWAAMGRRLADIGRRSAVGRLAQLILEIEARLKKRGLATNGTFAFPARQDDIADALGLTPAHVNRTLVDLRKRGIIEFRRDEFRILNVHALRQIAEEE